MTPALQIIPNWLRSLRMHKHTGTLEGLKDQELIVHDDGGPEESSKLSSLPRMFKVLRLPHNGLAGSNHHRGWLLLE